MRRSRLLPRHAPLLLLLLAAVCAPVAAKLEAKAWRELEADCRRLFSDYGEQEAKLEALARVVEDGEARSWRLLTDLLIMEATLWVRAERAVQTKTDQIASVLRKPSSKRVPTDEDNLRQWQAEIEQLEVQARTELLILQAVVNQVAEGPEALRTNILSRARGSPDWAVRAAAAQVAARTLAEEKSYAFLKRALDTDKDPRVRMAALEALRDLEGDAVATAEPLILGRLGDGEWGVQLLAVHIVYERRMVRAVPHLIMALEFASPRVGERIGEVLRDLTGENFDPYADVWARWWEEHKEEFQSDMRVRAGENRRPPSDANFYGLIVKSDRVVFIIDISSSMKLETQNENPAGEQPSGPVTHGEGDPPPPPPEEILSGPKIDVAKHELKKALKKLPPKAKFNIIAFNHAVLQWRDEMMDASPANVEEALKWVRALRPSGSTYIDGALRLAFRLAGLGAVDKAYPEINVDTILLLSDGAPTDNGFPVSQLMDPDVILEHVDEWNRHKRVVVHTIGIDMVEGIEFLKRLAARNGGIYVDR